MELSATELRIGNWVTAPAFELPFQVDLMTISQASHCQPIYLDEQWLKDFGCIKVNDEYHLSIDRKNRLCIQDDMSYCIEEIGGGGNLIVFDDDFLEYVHQLHDIYSTFTKKELIKT